MHQGKEIALPPKWDERQISLDISRFKNDQGALGAYLGGVVARFVSGQNTQTMESRTKFLESFNQYAEVARESYKWQRYMQGTRAQHEEDALDMEAEIKLRAAEARLAGTAGNSEYDKLQREDQQLAMQIEIARKRKMLEDINSPPPSVPEPPPAPAAPSAAQAKASELAELEASEKTLKERIRITKVDPTLEEEMKQRQLNLLENRLAEVQERLVQLL